MTGLPVGVEDSEKDRLRSHIETLKELVRMDWVRMAAEHMTPKERRELRSLITACIADLVNIGARLEKLDADRT